jgi:hypothetical protein
MPGCRERSPLGGLRHPAFIPGARVPPPVPAGAAPWILSVYGYIVPACVRPCAGQRQLKREKEADMSAPAYRAYTVIKRDGKDDFWLNLGVAFPHEDGEGFNLCRPSRSTAKSCSAPTRSARKSSRRCSNQRARAITRSRIGRVRRDQLTKGPSATTPAALLLTTAPHYFPAFAKRPPFGSLRH